jgi:hypothetical protein
VRRDEFDYSPFVQAMAALCNDHRRDKSGIGFLQHVVEVFDLVRPPFRGATDEQLSRGLQDIAFYLQWICETFPEAHRPKPERN